MSLSEGDGTPDGVYETEAMGSMVFWADAESVKRSPVREQGEGTEEFHCLGTIE